MSDITIGQMTELDRALRGSDVFALESGGVSYKISAQALKKSIGGATLTAKTITANGTYDPADDGADGYSGVTADVPNTYAAGDEGKVVANGALVSQTARADEITANGEYDTTLNNSVTVNVSGGAVLTTKTITENGTYNASADNADGYSSVTVDVSGGGGSGVPLVSAADWDALTTAQKQAYGLVAIQNTNSGYNRGILVYGGDYVPIGIYLPYSNENAVVCEAYTGNFNGLQLEWGMGERPIQLTARVSLDSQEAAVYIPVNTSGTLAYVDLGAVATPFTAYVVMKGVNMSAYSRLLSAMYARSTAYGILLYGSPVMVSSWGSDTSTGISATSYFAAAIQFAGSERALGVVYGASAFAKYSFTAGRYLTIGRTDIDPSPNNAEPCDVFVRYLGVVASAETQQAIEANLASLYTQFVVES